MKKLLIILFNVLIFQSCIDRYKEFEEEHLSYFVTQNWYSVNAEFKMLFDKSFVTVIENGDTVASNFSYRKNLVVLDVGNVYEIGYGMQKDLYFIKRNGMFVYELNIIK